MSTLSVRLPDELKAKVLQLTKKENISLSILVNQWLQTAVLRDETIEWMKQRLQHRNPDRLIADFGKFLEKTKPGVEPTLDEIREAMKE